MSAELQRHSSIARSPSMITDVTRGGDSVHVSSPCDWHAALAVLDDLIFTHRAKLRVKPSATRRSFGYRFVRSACRTIDQLRRVSRGDPRNVSAAWVPPVQSDRIGLPARHRQCRAGARIYHLRQRALYSTIGEADSRLRKPVTLSHAIQRLMVLDIVEAPTWCGSGPPTRRRRTSSR